MTFRLLDCLPWCNHIGCDGSECAEYPDKPTLTATADPRCRTEVTLGRIVWDSATCLSLRFYAVRGDGTDDIQSAEMTIGEAGELLTALVARIAQVRAAAEADGREAVKRGWVRRGEGRT